MSLRSQYLRLLSLFTVLVDLIPMVQMDFDAKLTDFGQDPRFDDLRKSYPLVKFDVHRFAARFCHWITSPLIFKFLL
jgi:hypothetical protein